MIVTHNGTHIDLPNCMTAEHCRKLNRVWVQNGSTETIHKVGGKLIVCQHPDWGSAMIRVYAEEERARHNAMMAHAKFVMEDLDDDLATYEHDLEEAQIAFDEHLGGGR